MPIPDKVKRRIVKTFGDPSLVLKIYDELGEDKHIDALLTFMEQRKLHETGFAGVGHIITFPDYGPMADVQVYGRTKPENPDDVYPVSIVLADGRDLPPELGRACLEETILFGKEAEFYLMYRYQGHEKQLKTWQDRFAL